MTKTISAQKFRELGFLQELNRQFLHPLGLALSVAIDDVTGEVSLGPIWDYRDDPEGIFFGDEILGTEEAILRAKYVNDLFEAKEPARTSLLGYPIQMIPLPDGSVL